MINYDVFISCKSEDYPYAHLIYKFLTDELGYVVFLADAELRKKGVAEYGEVIDEALDSAEHLILFSSKVEYINSSYVRNEWRTFLEEKRSGRKSGNILTVLKDVTISSLPISLRHFQSFTYDRYKDVKDFLPHSTPKHSSISTPAPAKTDKVGDYYNDGVREEAERKAREEAERKAREEAERNAREEAERKAREAAERKAREEAERKAREAAREEAARKASEEAERRRRLGIYAVGDYYNDGEREGVVFEVSADGRHGKIASMKQSAELQWAINERKFGLFKSEAERLIGADSETDGAANMAKVKAISGWREKYPAFAWCADLGEGWYLPSKEELLTIYKNKYKLNPNLTDKLSEGWHWHWSSTESDYKYSSGFFCAWNVRMNSGNTYYNAKDDDYYVRAVSAF